MSWLQKKKAALPNPARDDLWGRLDPALEEAQNAFWAVIVKHYPEADSGDFPPDATFAFDQAIKDAAETWIAFNVPGAAMNEDDDAVDPANAPGNSPREPGDGPGDEIQLF